MMLRVGGEQIAKIEMGNQVKINIRHHIFVLGIVSIGICSAQTKIPAKKPSPPAASSVVEPQVLIDAVNQKDLQAVRLAIGRGASANTVTDGVTPLWLADSSYARTDSSPIVDYMVAASLSSLKTAPSVQQIRSAVVASMEKAMQGTGTRSPVRLFQVYPDASVRSSIRVRCDAGIGNDSALYVVLDASGHAIDMAGSAPTALHVGASQFGHDVQLLPPTTAKDDWTGVIVDRIPYEQAEDIRALITKGGDVNTNSSRFTGGTPLLAASLIGDNDLISALLDRGANSEASGQGGITPLLLCSHRGNARCVALILKGGKLGATAGDGAKAMFVAAENGHSSIVTLLLASGADANAVEPGGSTPLHVAAWKGYDDIVALLLKKGAKRDLKDSDGDTALDIAKRQGHTAVIKLLQPPVAAPKGGSSSKGGNVPGKRGTSNS